MCYSNPMVDDADPPEKPGEGKDAPEKAGKPRLDSIEPRKVPLVGGVRVSLVGEGFCDACKVKLIDYELQPTFESKEALWFWAPPRAFAGGVEVRVVCGDAQSDAPLTDAPLTDAPLTDAIEVEWGDGPAPEIVSLSPASGPLSGGTEVVVHGVHLASGARAFFGEVEATVAFDAAIQLRLTTPARTLPGVVELRIALPDGRSVVKAAAFEYLRAAPPRIERVSPASGPARGGTTVVLEGTGLDDRCRVDVEGLPVAATRLDAARLSFVTPPRREGGAAWVRVTNLDGQFDVTREGFVYDALRAGPTVTSIEPTRLLASEKTTDVLVLGDGFERESKVEIGGLAAAFAFESGQRITVTAPPRGPVGAVDLRIVNPDGQETRLRGALEYQLPPPPPGVVGLRPARGPVLGGTTVLIHGANFVEGTRVEFGGRLVRATFDGVATLTAITPDYDEAETVSVRVVRPDGASCQAEGGFTYELLPTPEIHAVSPTRGPASGGTVVSIEGRNFVVSPPTVVRVGRTAVPAKVESPTRITFAMPPGEPGYVDLRVQNPDGQALHRPNAFMLDRSSP
jgi:hypothetical protein